ncbi:MAG TPA: hypothetical protein VMW34_15735 [Anaerolineales bacterium]|nr:hypothetical protein [Anaerolineales bacterium]
MYQLRRYCIAEIPGRGWVGTGGVDPALAHSEEKTSAIAWPMPRKADVILAALPFRCGGISVIFASQLQK